MSALVRRRGADVPSILLSDRAEDVGPALALIHDGFVEAGYMTPRPSGRRLHPAYLNPGSFFTIARIGGEMAGTMAIVADGPFGLPCERAFAEEVDQLREMTGARPYEAGSRVVPAPWRVRAGRISTFMIASIVNTARNDFPDSPVLITVAPEAERFLTATFDCERLAGPRPLFGAPAVLLLTSARLLEEHFARALTSTQQMMASLSLDPDPAWITDRRTGCRLEADWLPTLIAEQGIASRLRGQIDLLVDGGPSMLESLTEASGPRIAA